jgi:predicted SprT family Zn-dependent metalloprotease
MKPTDSGQDDSKLAQRPARPLQQALDLAAVLMDEHGLAGWSVTLDHARRRAGQCDYTNKRISLSRHYVRHAEDSHIRDTILHEIAHALVGPKHGHDAVWRQKGARDRLYGKSLPHAEFC